MSVFPFLSLLFATEDVIKNVWGKWKVASFPGDQALKLSYCKCKAATLLWRKCSLSFLQPVCSPNSFLLWERHHCQVKGFQMGGVFLPAYINWLQDTLSLLTQAGKSQGFSPPTPKHHNHAHIFKQLGEMYRS